MISEYCNSFNDLYNLVLSELTEKNMIINETNVMYELFNYMHPQDLQKYNLDIVEVATFVYEKFN